jgi:hypothetical protein
MRFLAFGRCASSIGVAAAILSGCGGSQAGAPPAVAQQNDATTGHSNRGSSKTHQGSETNAFTVSGRTILLNGQPFYIKGVDYGNTQIDAYADPNPLDNANEAVWGPDLDAMRAAGVNSVKVYNVSLASFKPYEDIIGGYNKLRPYEKGEIDKFLKKAWNGGDHPIYVVLSIFFGGVNVLQPRYLNALKAVYELTAEQYSADPAVMGFSLGSEINSEEFIGQPAWWKGLNEISGGIKKGYKTADAEKIITTTMVDDGLRTVVAGEKNDFKIDAWGIDAYRGRTFGNIWNEIKRDTQKPEIMAEYGASSGWYPPSSATYDDAAGHCPKDTYPPGSFPPPNPAPFWGLPGPRPWELVRELPPTGNPRAPFLVGYVKGNATELFDNSTSKGGVGSGGYYFEWNDEWWKSGWPFSHIGGFDGNIIAPNTQFPGCYDDQAWFGLNADRKNGSGDPFPKRAPDTRAPRPTLQALKNVWAQE